MKNFNKELLESLYLNEKKTPHQIANHLNCDHKTVRKYLRMHGIPLRSASEYNYLAKVTHEPPSSSMLRTPVSLMAHAAYLCEGWHTETTTSLHFCNTDTLLLDLFLRCIRDVYRVKEDSIRFSISARTAEDADILLQNYPRSRVYLEESRKTPIVRIVAGGKTLAAEFIKNAYNLIQSQ